VKKEKKKKHSKKGKKKAEEPVEEETKSNSALDAIAEAEDLEKEFAKLTEGM